MRRATVTQLLGKIGFQWGVQQWLNNEKKQDSNGVRNNSLMLR